MGLLDSISDIGSSILGGATSAIGGIAGDYLGNALIGEPNSSKAYKRSREAYMSRYQDTVKDMNFAGLNPILAATGGFNVGQSVDAKMPQYTTTNYGQTAKGYAEAKKIRTVDTDLAKKQAIQASANAINLRRQSDKFKAEERKLTREYTKLFYEMVNLAAQAEKTLAEKGMLLEEADLLKQKANEIKLNMVKLIKISDLYRPAAAKYMVYMQEVFKTLGLPLSILGGGALMRSR